MLLEIIRPYILAFIPIFIAIDMIGSLPSFLVLTEGFSHRQKKRLTRESILYALIITIICIIVSGKLLHFIGVLISDVKIAGGILLLVLAVNVLLFGKITNILQDKKQAPDLGIFPLGVPIIVNPAFFIVSLIILENFGILVTLIAVTLNMFLFWIVLENSVIINRVVGKKGIRSFSKILEILLSVFAIMLIRQGIMGAFIK